MILAHTEYDFRGHKVEFLPYSRRINVIFSPVYPIFKFFCMINLKQK